jgi:hypothetical protein
LVEFFTPLEPDVAFVEFFTPLDPADVVELPVAVVALVELFFTPLDPDEVVELPVAVVALVELFFTPLDPDEVVELPVAVVALVELFFTPLELEVEPEVELEVVVELLGFGSTKYLSQSQGARTQTHGGCFTGTMSFAMSVIMLISGSS